MQPNFSSLAYAQLFEQIYIFNINDKKIIVKINKKTSKMLVKKISKNFDKYTNKYTNELLT